MSEQRALFDATRTVPVRCPVCHTIRDAGEDRAPGCDIDRDRQNGTWQRRPAGCLNQHNPETAPFPEGF